MARRRRSSQASLDAAIAKAAESPTGRAPLPPVRRRLRRTWPQRFVLAFNSLVIVGLFAGATAIVYANNRLGARRLVDLSAPSGLPAPPAGDSGDPSGDGAPEVATTVATTIPEVIDPEPKNFVLTASDARECIDPNSPDAGSFLGEGSGLGERADTIMMVRVDAANNQAAILSFPRDLWVKIGTSDRKSRINSALDVANPAKLIETLYRNFGLPVDHWINIDFCAFKDVVDAVGGVAVPFWFAARDDATGFYVGEPGCHTFDGLQALQYVRSRKYKYLDNGRWRSDNTSDFGRISRQQDFLKRAVQKAFDRGATNPSVAKGLLDSFLKNVITDSDLTVGGMLDLVQAMRNYDPTTAQTFQVKATGMMQGEAQVLRPLLDDPFNVKIFRVFRGQARLADLRDVAEVEQTPPSSVAPTTTGGSATTVDPTTTGSATTIATATTPPTSIYEIESNLYGISPPPDYTCR